MVEQTQPGRVSLSPARSPHYSAPAESAVSAAATAPFLLLLVVVFLMVPGTFQLAGTTLSPYRVLLLGLFPLLVWRWINNVAGRPNIVDTLVVLSACWSVL